MRGVEDQGVGSEPADKRSHIICACVYAYICDTAFPWNKYIFLIKNYKPTEELDLVKLDSKLTMCLCINSSNRIKHRDHHLLVWLEGAWRIKSSCASWYNPGSSSACVPVYKYRTIHSKTCFPGACLILYRILRDLRAINPAASPSAPSAQRSE